MRSLAGVLLISAFLHPESLTAQSFSGDILGFVTDQSSAEVPNASIKARQITTNASFETKSAIDGSYILPRLLPGDYELTVEATGFKRFVAPLVTLRVGSRITVNVQLQVGEVSTAVEVAAAAQLVSPDDVTVGQVITEKSISALPLNGRNFIQLAQLSPGVTVIDNANSPVTAWTGRKDLSIVVAGLRENDTSYLLDGIETRSPRFGGSGFRPSVDAIQEFNVQRNAFTADQGWGTTVVNVLLKSGTNSLHGDAFYFIRNDAVDARNFFDGRTKPPYKQNQWGFTVGGPIKKDKIFFFGDSEGFRSRLSNTLLGRIPTPQMLQGNSTATLKDPLDGQPFENNTIPSGRFDAVARNVLAFIPAPNRPQDPALNYGRAATTLNDWDQFHIKADWNISSKNRAFARYSYVDERLLQPTLLPNQGLSRPLGDQNVVLEDTHIVSSSVVNELHLGWNHNRAFNVNQEAFGADKARDIGLQNTPTNPASFALPQFAMANFSPIGQNFTQNQEAVDNLYGFSDNLSYTRGRHAMKVGADIRLDRLFVGSDYPSSPYFTFSGQYSGDSVADFLLGLPIISSTFFGDSRAHYTSWQWSFYAQDNFKVTPTLNLYFGLRYEIPGQFVERDDKQGYFDFSTKQVRTIKNDHLPRTLRPTDMNNFAPRFGFAYSVHPRTVIRGGFGLFYDLISANETQHRGVLLPPVEQIVTLNNTLPTPSYQLSRLFPPPTFATTFQPVTQIIADRTPYVYQYNLNVQHQINSVLVELGYVGLVAHKLNRRFNNNLAAPGPGSLESRRPYKGFPDILTSQNDGWSDYNGLNFKVEKNFSRGLLLLFAYTYGKALDIGGPDEYAHRDSTGVLKDLRGPAQIDTRQRAVTSYVYELPFGKGKKVLGNVSNSAVSGLVGGWQINGISTFASGHPLTPSMPFDNAQIGARRYQPENCTGPVNSSGLQSEIRNHATLFPYFNVQNVLPPPPGTMGSCGRNGIIGPGINNWDLGLIKNTQVTEGVAVQFRAEFFNAWNHAQFNGLNTSIGNPNFGRLTSARAPRDIQFGLKFLF